MKQREKWLALLFASVVAIYCGNWLFETALRQPLETRRGGIEKLKTRIEKLQNELSNARESAKVLAVWESQSLPADVGQARHLYQEWLTQLVNAIGLTDLNVSSSEPANRKGNFDALSFSVRGRGTLEQLVEFLFEFYSADHLHQIQTLDITPNAQTEQLDLSVTVEALVLPGADRKDRLTLRKSNRLASASLADYMPIPERNLFRIGGSSPDATDHAYLTAVIDAGGQMEAWFTLRASDKSLRLRQGDKIDVGHFHGTVAEIADADVVIESDGERWLMTVGESLAQASSLPPEY
jgi:hypothetical protein